MLSCGLLSWANFADIGSKQVHSCVPHHWRCVSWPILLLICNDVVQLILKFLSFGCRRMSSTCIVTRHKHRRYQVAYIVQVISEKFRVGNQISHLDFFLDGAHTPESLTACGHWFADISPTQTDSRIPQGKDVQVWSLLRKIIHVLHMSCPQDSRLAKFTTFLSKTMTWAFAGSAKSWSIEATRGNWRLQATWVFKR